MKIHMKRSYRGKALWDDNPFAVVARAYGVVLEASYLFSGLSPFLYIDAQYYESLGALNGRGAL